MRAVVVLVVGYLVMFASTFFFSYQLYRSEKENYELRSRLEVEESIVYVLRRDLAKTLQIDAVFQEKPREVELPILSPELQRNETP